MVDQGFNLGALSAMTGVDQRTLQHIWDCDRKTGRSTLSKLAKGLGVDAAALLVDRRSPLEQFDRQTNPVAAAYIDAHPRVVQDWEPGDYADFLSRVGKGGPQTDEGAAASAKRINLRRTLVEKLGVLLETPSAAAVRGVIESLYARETSVD